MSSWSYINGNILLKNTVTEDALLSMYGKVSHNLVGSEGGVKITFTRTQEKDWSATSEDNYKVENYSRLENMLIIGSLRNFSDDKLILAVEALKNFLQELHEYKLIERASFVLECNYSDHYYLLSYVKGRVRVKKVKISLNKEE